MVARVEALCGRIITGISRRGEGGGASKEISGEEVMKVMVEGRQEIKLQ